ncbi:MAG: TolC family protein [Smithellaceae bacterium]|nr:TolC family protein [Smithellaceae bacterium]
MKIDVLRLSNHVCLGWRLGAGMVLLAAFLFLSSAAASAQTRVFSLEEALAIAAEKNRDIEKARVYIAWAQGKYVEERAAAFPQLTASASLGWDQDESQKIYSPMQTQRTERRSAQIGLTQPLFTWGQVSAAIRAARVGLQSAEEQLRIYQQAAKRDVSAAFHDVLLARELHRLALHSLEQKKRHQEEARRKLQAGVATDYDVLAAEVSVENARPDTIRTENKIRIARERLRFLLAIEKGEVDVTGGLEADLIPHRSYEEAFALAREKRPDLADIRYRIGLNRELVVLAAAQDKPRVDLKGAYGWNYLEQPTVYGDGPSWSVGVQLSYPFFDGFRTRGRVAQAESDLKRIQIDEARRIDAVALETRDAVNAVRESEDIVRSLSGTVNQAERLLTMAEKGYELGVKTRLEVEDAELNLRQAKSSLSRARRDYLVARVNLDWVTGILGEQQK